METVVVKPEDVKIGDYIYIECLKKINLHTCSKCGASEETVAYYEGTVEEIFNAVTLDKEDSWQITVRNKQTNQWFRWRESLDGGTLYRFRDSGSRSR
jgi:hypothetical protein